MDARPRCVDGRWRCRKTINADYIPNTAMYVVLSNSVSSIHGPSGEPDEKTVFPNEVPIDYVRVYQAPLHAIPETVASAPPTPLLPVATVLPIP